MSFFHKHVLDKKRWALVRLAVLDAANWQCSACKQWANEVDHRVIPLHRGGDPYATSRICKPCAAALADAMRRRLGRNCARSRRIDRNGIRLWRQEMALSEREQSRAIGRELREAVEDVTVQLAKDITLELSRATPEDTGLAQESWIPKRGNVRNCARHNLARGCGACCRSGVARD